MACRESVSIQATPRRHRAGRQSTENAERQDHAKTSARSTRDRRQALSDGTAAAAQYRGGPFTLRPHRRRYTPRISCSRTRYRRRRYVVALGPTRSSVAFLTFECLSIHALGLEEKKHLSYQHQTWYLYVIQLSRVV